MLAALPLGVIVNAKNTRPALVGELIAGRNRSASPTTAPSHGSSSPNADRCRRPTEAQARYAGRDVTIVRVDLTRVAGGSLLGKDITGSAQLVIDDDRRVIVGATFTGPGVGELLHAATIAVIGEVPIDRLWRRSRLLAAMGSGAIVLAACATGGSMSGDLATGTLCGASPARRVVDGRGWGMGVGGSGRAV
jgi:hypothetical protein